MQHYEWITNLQCKRNINFHSAMKHYNTKHKIELLLKKIKSNSSISNKSKMQYYSEIKLHGYT